MHTVTRVSVLLILSLVAALPGYSNDRRFTYTYETSVLLPGAREIETWNTYRSGREYFYRGFDQRVEYEFGVSRNLMGSVYLNATNSFQDSAGVTKSGDPISSSSLGFSTEWKYKLMDRVADPLGLALYGEFTAGPSATELEGKLLMDKEIGRSLLAFNAVLERGWDNEIENGSASTSADYELEFDAGFSYAISNQFSAGLEAQNVSEIEGGEIETSPLFLGLVAAYESEGWWTALTFMPQVTTFAGATSGHLDLEAHEKYEARILLSFHI